MNINEAKIKYLLHLADNALILSQRLGEWCGHGPVLEQDMAMTNIALDYIGRARLLYQYAAAGMGDQTSEDQLAFLREEKEYLNFLLVEQANTDFAYTVARQFFLDAFHFPYFMALKTSSDKHLADIAEKTVKESAYHLKWSSEWMIRLGDGTEESHSKIQTAVDDLWSFTGELFDESPFEKNMSAEGIAPAIQSIKKLWMDKLVEIFTAAKLKQPVSDWSQTGGKSGIHTEHMGYLLAEMQYMQRTYPGMEW
jgi:ring-1,2-phenylacetyl-CoA epoxidase subunit PaaC